MKIIYMGNNFVGWQVLKWLVKQGESIVALLVHENYKAKFRGEIIEAAGLEAEAIFEGPQLVKEEVKDKLKTMNPDLILSIMFDYILKKDILDIPRYGSINLHNGYLPYNAGNYANVWSIVEKTPAGATIHYMDEGIDTGPIIDRQEVKVLFNDTGETLFHKLEETCIEIFKRSWPKIQSLEAKGHPQPPRRTYHRKRDIEKIDFIDLDKTYRAGDIIDILRARTFPPYESAYTIVNGEKYFIRVSIQKEDS